VVAKIAGGSCYVIFGAEIEEIQQPFLAIRLASDGNMMLVKMCNVLVG